MNNVCVTSPWECQRQAAGGSQSIVPHEIRSLSCRGAEYFSWGAFTENQLITLEYTERIGERERVVVSTDTTLLVLQVASISLTSRRGLNLFSSTFPSHNDGTKIEILSLRFAMLFWKMVIFVNLRLFKQCTINSEGRCLSLLYMVVATC